MPLYAGIEEAVDAAAGTSSVPRGRLRVNADSAVVRMLLAPRLEAFLRAHPEVSVELVVRDRIPDLVAEGFDLAVRFGAPELASIAVRRLFDARVVTYAAPAYLARRGRPKHPRDLVTQEHECILFRDPATGRPFPWEFHRRGRVVPVAAAGRLVVNDLASAETVCAAGLGIGQFIDRSVDELVRRKVLVEVLSDWAEERYPAYLIFPSRHLLSAKVRAFADFVAAASGHPPRA